MTKRIELQREFALWSDKTILDFSKRYSGEMPPERYALQNGLFVTLTFETLRIAARKRHDAYKDSRRGTPETFNFAHFYNVMCRRVIGPNFLRQSKRDQLPLALCALDVNGTRYWRTAGEAENVHIHSIWIFQPGQRECFERAIEALKASREGNVFDFDKIDIKPIDAFDPSPHRPSKLSDYSSKFLAFNAQTMSVADDLLVFPLTYH